MPQRYDDMPDEFKANFPGVNPTELIYTWISEDGEIQVPESLRESMVQSGTPPSQFKLFEQPQRVGEVGSSIFSPLQCFVDHSVLDLRRLPPQRWAGVAQPRTNDWIMANFADTAEFDLETLDGRGDVKIVTTTLTQNGPTMAFQNVQQLIPAIQGTLAKDDPDMEVVCDFFQPPSDEFPEGRMVVFIPKKGILLNQEIPYPDFPLTDYHFTPPKTTHWTGGYTEHLIQGNQFLNRRMQQLGEYGNHFIESPYLLGGALTEDDVTGEFPNYIEGGLTPEGQPLVQQAQPPQVPGWFQKSIDHANEFLTDLAGGQDLFGQNKFPGQLRGTFGAPILQEMTDSQFAPFLRHVFTRMAIVKEKRLNIVREFYPPVRTMHITNRDETDEVIEFHKEEIMPAGTSFTFTVLPSTILPEMRGMRELRVAEQVRNFPMMFQDQEDGRWLTEKIAEALQIPDNTTKDAREKSRKLAQRVIEALKMGQSLQSVPPVTPWQQHGAMLEEFQDFMNESEFWKLDEPTRQNIMQYWSQIAQVLQQKAQQAQQAQQQAGQEEIINQAAQQAAIKGATQAVEIQSGQFFEGLRKAAAQGVTLEQAIQFMTQSQAGQEQ
jgi:hypothetical protein